MSWGRERLADLLAQTRPARQAGSRNEEAPRGGASGWFGSGGAPVPRQPAGFSRAASALITWNSLSSPPAMPASVTYLPFTTMVGVLVMR